jgi:hypothetical protein
MLSENIWKRAVHGWDFIFVASPNDWYKYEIWHSGYYPVAWTNINYKMLYINMGHNDIHYDNKTNKELSFTFRNKTQSKLILDGLFWLGKGDFN